MNIDSPILFVTKGRNEILRYWKDGIYRNLTTGAAMKIKDEEAKKHLTYPIIINTMAAKNPLICDLIKTLGATYEGTELNENIEV